MPTPATYKLEIYLQRVERMQRELNKLHDDLRHELIRG
jgi:uncharacterized protein (UPF0335 family)